MVSISQDFLFEIGTEELPPKALRKLGDALGGEAMRALEKASLAHLGIQSFCTPRRLALLVSGLCTAQPDTVCERRGPPLNNAFDGDGNPTPAALGFARSCGVDIEHLETLENDKGAWLVFRYPQKGRSSRELLPSIMEEVLAHLPIPKRMRWGSLRAEFVRPVHWLVMLYGDEVIASEMFGIRAGRKTRGHRFHHPEPIFLAEPAAYVPLLASEGRVMADFEGRRKAIHAQVQEAAVGSGGQAVIDEQLLDEVTGMVEWPVALTGRFEDSFLSVPAEALISAMKAHQKYFHIIDERGHLVPRFITVANIDSVDMDVVRAGNERVIRPRLADAAFFWDQDRKQPLADRREQLKAVIFQTRLGTLYQKTERLVSLAGNIATLLGGDRSWAERAAALCKCDLLTEMVGEFPELQGIMGCYYAAHDQEPPEVARALDEQYLPRFAGGRLPGTLTGQALAIADKLDSIVGIFWIGQRPTGAKDPFALRRAALGVLRIMIECRLDLDLAGLLDSAVECYNGQGNVTLSGELTTQIYEFMMERLRTYYLEKDIGYDVFEAVLARRPTRPHDFDLRLRAVETFRTLPEAASLAAANKRITNILRQAVDEVPDTMDATLFAEDAERALAEQVITLSATVSPLLEGREYTTALTRLASLRGPVDTFFEEVLVMTEEAALRRNRLALLATLRRLFLRVADLSRLQAMGQ